jgi:hypothetical protein
MNSHENFLQNNTNGCIYCIKLIPSTSKCANILNSKLNESHKISELNKLYGRFCPNFIGCTIDKFQNILNIYHHKIYESCFCDHISFQISRYAHLKCAMIHSQYNFTRLRASSVPIFETNQFPDMQNTKSTVIDITETGIETETTDIVETETTDIVEEVTNVVETETTDVVEEVTNVVETETTDVVEAKTTDVVEAKTTDVVETETTDVVETETTDVMKAKTTDVVETETTDVMKAKTTDVVETETTDVVEDETKLVNTVLMTVDEINDVIETEI